MKKLSLMRLPMYYPCSPLSPHRLYSLAVQPFTCIALYRKDSSTCVVHKEKLTIQQCPKDMTNSLSSCSQSTCEDFPMVPNITYIMVIKDRLTLQSPCSTCNYTAVYTKDKFTCDSALYYKLKLMHDSKPCFNDHTPEQSRNEKIHHDIKKKR